MDRYQIEEFDQHWSATYCNYKDSLGYVLGAFHDERNSVEASVKIFDSAGNAVVKKVKMEDVIPLNIPMGFYELNRAVGLFSRHPAQNVRRGLYNRNASVSVISLDEKKQLLKSLVDFTWDRIHTVWKQTKAVEPGSLEEAKYEFGEGLRGGMVLSKDYSLIRMQEEVVIIGLSGVVGKMSLKNNTFRLRADISFLSDGIKEAFKNKFRAELKEMNV